jgi:(S)-3,5-dihydroxyphenylglycine transaminase
MMKQIVQVRAVLRQPFMGVMNFLNEAALRYPDAISFAAGRPPDRFASAECSARWVSRFVQESVRATNAAEEAIWQSLGQYGPTNGIIGELVCRLLERDEGMKPAPTELMITNGMQEALAILLLGVLRPGHDIMLCDDPSYVGIAGAAALAGVTLRPLQGPGSLPQRVESTLAHAEGELRPRALYVVPDFSNPLGQTLTRAEREQLLAIAQREGLLLVEDTAYRAFRYDGEVLPSLKAMDTEGVVVQLGSFSKLFMPGPRVGYLYADQLTAPAEGEAQTTLAHELSKVKSFVSVQTSPYVQAAVGGFLLEQGFTLTEWNRPRVEFCRNNRDALLRTLQEQIGDDDGLRQSVRWSRPDGGFFLTLHLPFGFGSHDVLACARDYGVLVCPMSYFSESAAFSSSIRLSFSNISAEQARTGVSRLRRFIHDRLAGRSPRRSSADHAVAMVQQP